MPEPESGASNGVDDGTDRLLPGPPVLDSTIVSCFAAVVVVVAVYVQLVHFHLLPACLGCLLLCCFVACC